jgi:predicted helicase
VRNIYQKFENNAGMWNDYVQNHLIPRLNGFEIMMSPYTMAHLKIETILQEFGYNTNNNNRLQIYLTDSLENPKQNVQQIPFAQWLSNEATEAAKIKNNAPVMVILGNPPYSVSSSNKGKWIECLMDDYKKDLNERNIQPLSDDYIKFIRFGQHYIEKNGEGKLV